VRISLDTNILIYAVGDACADKKQLAKKLVIHAAASEGILTQQVYGEFFNVCAKKAIIPKVRVIEQVVAWQRFLPPAATDPKDYIDAFALANRYQLQFWDSVILCVCAQQNASILFSEDMQDGATYAGVTIIDPFNPGNSHRIETLMSK
jgi:predicted nucleic acid-binding protein